MTTLPRTSDTATRRAEQTSTPRRADAGDAEQTPDHVPWESLTMAAQALFIVILMWKASPAQRRRRHGFPPGTRLMGRALLASRVRRGKRTVTRLVAELADGGWLTIVRHPRAQIDGRWVSLEVQGYVPRRKPPHLQNVRPQRAANVAANRESPGRTEWPFLASHPFQGSKRRGGGSVRTARRDRLRDPRPPKGFDFGAPPGQLCPHGVIDGARWAPATNSYGFRTVGGCHACAEDRLDALDAAAAMASRPPEPAPPGARCAHGVTNGARWAVDGSSVGGCVQCEDARAG